MNPPILELNSSAPTNLVLLVYGQKGSNYLVVTGTNPASPSMGFDGGFHFDEFIPIHFKPK